MGAFRTETKDKAESLTKTLFHDTQLGQNIGL